MKLADGQQLSEDLKQLSLACTLRVLKEHCKSSLPVPSVRGVKNILEPLLAELVDDHSQIETSALTVILWDSSILRCINHFDVTLYQVPKN